MPATTRMPLRSMLAMLLATIVLACPAARAQAEDAGDDGGDDERVLVATVLEQPVYVDMVQPPKAAMERMRGSMGEREYEAWLTQQRTRILSQYLFGRLASAYEVENGIAVGEDEIDAFLRREKQAYVDVIKDYEKRIEDLRAQADRITARGGQVSDEHMREIILYQKKIENLERKNVANLVISDKQRQMFDEVQRQRVAKSLKAWKFNRLLHEQFGGRVVVQDLTYRPFEAQAEWLEIQEQLGGFEISDPVLRAGFWNVYRDTPAGAIEPFEGMWDQLRWHGSGMP